MADATSNHDEITNGRNLLDLPSTALSTITSHLLPECKKQLALTNKAFLPHVRSSWETVIFEIESPKAPPAALREWTGLRSVICTKNIEGYEPYEFGDAYEDGPEISFSVLAMVHLEKLHKLIHRPDRELRLILDPQYVKSSEDISTILRVTQPIPEDFDPLAQYGDQCIINNMLESLGALMIHSSSEITSTRVGIYRKYVCAYDSDDDAKVAAMYNEVEDPEFDGNIRYDSDLDAGFASDFDSDSDSEYESDYEFGEFDHFIEPDYLYRRYGIHPEHGFYDDDSDDMYLRRRERRERRFIRRQSQSKLDRENKRSRMNRESTSHGLVSYHAYLDPSLNLDRYPEVATLAKMAPSPLFYTTQNLPMPRSVYAKLGDRLRLICRTRALFYKIFMSELLKRSSNTNQNNNRGGWNLNFNINFLEDDPADYVFGDDALLFTRTFMTLYGGDVTVAPVYSSIDMGWFIPYGLLGDFVVSGRVKWCPHATKNVLMPYKKLERLQLCLGECAGVRGISLETSLANEAMVCLKPHNMPRLTQLHLNAMHYGDGLALSPFTFANLTQLTRLHLEYPLYPRSFSIFKPLTSLDTLHVRFCMDAGPTTTVPQDSNELTALPKLTNLTLAEWTVTQQQSFAELTQLTSLSLQDIECESVKFFQPERPMPNVIDVMLTTIPWDKDQTYKEQSKFARWGLYKGYSYFPNAEIIHIGSLGSAPGKVKNASDLREAIDVVDGHVKDLLRNAKKALFVQLDVIFWIVNKVIERQCGDGSFDIEKKIVIYDDDNDNDNNTERKNKVWDRSVCFRHSELTDILVAEFQYAVADDTGTDGEE